MFIDDLWLPRLVRPLLAEGDDEGGGGGDDAGKGDAGKAASLLDLAGKGDDGKADDGGDDAAKAAAAAAAKAAEGDDGKAKPPEGEISVTLARADIPENFIDKDGVFKPDSLFKSWRDQQNEIKRLQNGQSKAPEKPEDYDYALNADQQEASKKVLAPGVDDDGNATEDVVIAGFRKFAHEKGMSKELFGDMVRWYIETTAPLVPTPVDQKAELAKLGTGAQSIIDATDRFGETLKEAGVFDDSMYEEFRVAASSASGLQMIQGIRDFYGEAPIPTQIAQHAANQPSAADLNAKLGQLQSDAMAGKITWEQASAGATKLEKEFEAVYGTDPSGASVVRQ